METFNYTTSCKTILADLYTPVGVYMRLRDIYPQSALMESSDYHDKDNARSFIGINPIASVAIGHGEATIIFPDGSHEEHSISTDYGTADAIHALIDRIHVEGDYATFCGLYGYTSFNAVRYFEHIAVKDETQEKNDAPDMLYILYKDIIVFDHFNSQLTMISLSKHPDESDIPEILRAMNKASIPAYDFHPVGDVTSPLTDEEHKANIRRGIKHCLRGDVFQIVLSRRFIQKYEGDDFKLYRALRSINPLLTFSILTLAVSVSSAPPLRHIAVSKDGKPISTPSPGPPSVREMQRKTVRGLSTYGRTLKRMPSM